MTPFDMKYNDEYITHKLNSKLSKIILNETTT
jgi:hypothetical protein